MADMNFFSGNQAAQGAAAAQGIQAAAGSLNSPATAMKIDAAANTQAAAIAPLDAFKGLWDTAATTRAAHSTGVLPQLTAEQLSQTLANSNFLSGVNPELMAKAAGGDAQAFQDVMNQGLRTVMTQSVLASHGLVETGARNHGEQLRTTLPSMVRSSNVNDSLQANPLYNNPAAKPMVDMVRAQIEAKHPQASAREIAELTNQFITEFAGVASPQQVTKPQPGKTAVGDTDWYSVLGLSS